MGSPEVDGKGGLHFHGFGVAESRERHALQNAMCEAAGPWRAYRNWQCVMHDNPPDSGWLSYLVEDWEKASPWPRYSAFRNLGRAAHAAFDEMRAFVLECDQPAQVQIKSALTSHIALSPTFTSSHKGYCISRSQY